MSGRKFWQNFPFILCGHIHLRIEHEMHCRCDDEDEEKKSKWSFCIIDMFAYSILFCCCFVSVTRNEMKFDLHANATPYSVK